MDLNNDGYPDILSGSYSRMEGSMAGLFQVLWGQAGRKFKEAAVLKGTDNEPLIVVNSPEKEAYVHNTCTRPTAVDWNADGKLDLLVGNLLGEFFFFKGEGNGRFSPKAEPVLFGTSNLRIEGQHSDPFVVDWDGDGDLDILSGSGLGGVQWAENTAGRGKPPAFEGFASTLIKPGRQYRPGELVSEQELTEPSHGTRVWVDDVNGDGKLDVLVGDHVTLVSIAKGLSREQYRQKLKKWEQAIAAANDSQIKAGNDEDREAARKREGDLYVQRKEFMLEDPTGYVWLYRRK